MRPMRKAKRQTKTGKKRIPKSVRGGKGGSISEPRPRENIKINL